jgi:hypothetical protein
LSLTLREEHLQRGCRGESFVVSDEVTGVGHRLIMSSKIYTFQQILLGSIQGGGVGWVTEGAWGDVRNATSVK